MSNNTVLTSFDTIIQGLEQDPQRLRDNWCLAPDAARMIYLLTLMLQARTVVEVGTSIGYSGLWFLKALVQTDGQLWTLDVSDERMAIAQSHFDAAGAGKRVQRLLGEAKDSLSVLSEQADFQADILFLDAHKADYVHYFEVAGRIIKPGGLVIADNTVSHREAMAPFLDAVSQATDWEWSDMQTPNGLLIARRKTS